MSDSNMQELIELTNPQPLPEQKKPELLNLGAPNLLHVNDMVKPTANNSKEEYQNTVANLIEKTNPVMLKTDDKALKTLKDNIKNQKLTKEVGKSLTVIKYINTGDIASAKYVAGRNYHVPLLVPKKTPIVSNKDLDDRIVELWKKMGVPLNNLGKEELDKASSEPFIPEAEIPEYDVPEYEGDTLDLEAHLSPEAIEHEVARSRPWLTPKPKHLFIRIHYRIIRHAAAVAGFRPKNDNEANLDYKKEVYKKIVGDAKFAKTFYNALNPYERKELFYGIVPGIILGDGLKANKKSIRALTIPDMFDKLKIVLGEQQAGNDNPQLKKHVRLLVTNLLLHNVISKDLANKIISGEKFIDEDDM